MNVQLPPIHDILTVLLMSLSTIGVINLSLLTTRHFGSMLAKWGDRRRQLKKEKIFEQKLKLDKQREEAEIESKKLLALAEKLGLRPQINTSTETVLSTGVFVWKDDSLLYKVNDENTNKLRFARAGDITKYQCVLPTMKRDVTRSYRYCVLNTDNTGKPYLTDKGELNYIIYDVPENLVINITHGVANQNKT